MEHLYLTATGMSTILRIMTNDAVLNEVADVRLGHPFRGAVPEVEGADVRVVQIRDLSRDGLKDRDALLRTELRGRKEPDWLQGEDVLFVAKGWNAFAAPMNGVPERTVCSQHMYVVRVKEPGTVLPAFLAWQLNQPPAQRYLRQSAEGSHQLSIRRAVLDATQIRIPPIEQQRVVVELERLARAEREALQKLIKNREAEMALLAESLLA